MTKYCSCKPPTYLVIIMVLLGQPMQAAGADSQAILYLDGQGDNAVLKIADDEDGTDSTEFDLEQLDNAQSDTVVANRLLAAGPTIMPKLCKKLHRARLLNQFDTESRDAFTNITFVMLAVAKKFPESVPEAVDCLFLWTTKAPRTHPMRFITMSMVAVNYGDIALRPLVETWERSSRIEGQFEHIQQIASEWFDFFCNRDGIEAETIDKLGNIAASLGKNSRLNLYSHISTLADCSEQAITVIKAAFSSEIDDDAKRALHVFQGQANKIAMQARLDRKPGVE